MRFARNALLAVALAALASAIALAIGIIVTDDDDSGSAEILELGDSGDPLSVATYRRNFGSPYVGDHWHAAYTIYIGDERQPNAPTWEGSGIHTHGDGIIHMHPFTPHEEGAGAALNRWFEYGGGELTETSMREPGASIEATVHNGDPVPGDGRPGEVFVILNGISPDTTSTLPCGGLDLAGQWVRVPVNYIPLDGDCIRIMFEPEEVMREHINNPPSVPTPIEQTQP